MVYYDFNLKQNGSKTIEHAVARFKHGWYKSDKFKTVRRETHCC